MIIRISSQENQNRTSCKQLLWPCYFPNQNEWWLKTRQWEKTSLKDYDNTTAPSLAATAPYTYFSLDPKDAYAVIITHQPLLVHKEAKSRKWTPVAQQECSSAEVCLVHGIRLELAHCKCRDTRKPQSSPQSILLYRCLPLVPQFLLTWT